MCFFGGHYDGLCAVLIGCVFVWTYIYEVMGVSVVCACCRRWRCLKVMLTVHTQTAPEESANLVDPLCML